MLKNLPSGQVDAKLQIAGMDSDGASKTKVYKIGEVGVWDITIIVVSKEPLNISWLLRSNRQ